MPFSTHLTLSTGAKNPVMGFGTWQAPNHEVVEAVKTALEVGYRHIECAAIYRNEAAIGDAIKQSGVAGLIFWNTKHDLKDIEEVLDNTLADLGTENLDPFLMHWLVALDSSSKWFPIDTHGVFKLSDIDRSTTYAPMEKHLATGKVRAIGVCNFTVNKLRDLPSKSSAVPATNQVEAHF